MSNSMTQARPSYAKFWRKGVNRAIERLVDLTKTSTGSVADLERFEARFPGAFADDSDLAAQAVAVVEWILPADRQTGPAVAFDHLAAVVVEVISCLEWTPKIRPMGEVRGNTDARRTREPRRRKGRREPEMALCGEK